MARAARGLSSQFAGDLDKIEVESAGRLGVAVLDTLSGERTGHRLDERFPMCSTFKLLAAAAILARVARSANASTGASPSRPARWW
jgi:beta-lactamase class A